MLRRQDPDRTGDGCNAGICGWGNNEKEILNLAVGGNFDGDPQSDTIFPATMLVDYVRVFEKK